MPITFVAVGKPKASWAAEAVEHYRTFLSKYTVCEFTWVRPVTRRTPDQIRQLEGDRLLGGLTKRSGYIIACDSRGEALASAQFAHKLRVGLDANSDRASIIIGGALGLDDSVLKAADRIWSFGPMTLPHELSLVCALEQVARAYSILRGEAYHK